MKSTKRTHKKERKSLARINERVMLSMKYLWEGTVAGDDGRTCVNLTKFLNELSKPSPNKENGANYRELKQEVIAKTHWRSRKKINRKSKPVEANKGSGNPVRYVQDRPSYILFYINVIIATKEIIRVQKLNRKIKHGV